MFFLPDLPYEYHSLEPFIDAETMRIHHSKHHAAYVKNLNDVLVGNDALLNTDINDILKDLALIPEDIRQKVINNGGGHANHSLFWAIIAPAEKTKKEPEGKLAEALEINFGDFPSFKELFTKTAVSRFGSGWAWLVVYGDGRLEILDTPNQDTPLSKGKTPILTLDVWEHAYYLKYQNRRAEYIEAWWNVINWEEVGRRFGEKSSLKNY